MEKYKGLTDSEVIISRNINGKNILTPPKKQSILTLFLEKFEDPIIRILLIAAILSFGISFIHMDFAETIGIFCAILLATGIAFFFELDANKKFDILNKVNDDIYYKVKRNNKICEVSKKDIVVGDIVILETGEEIPADGELLVANSLQIDESCLTGEPLIDKFVEPSNFSTEATYPSNWAMRGTKILNGNCVLEIKTVGDSTEFGKAAEKSTEMSGEITPLNRQLDKLAKFIGVIGFSLALVTFLTLFIKDLFINTYPLIQIGSICIVFFSMCIVLTKVWYPIITDALELLGKNTESKMSDFVENASWFKFIIYGFITFVILISIGFLFNINPLDSNNWNIDIASNFLKYFMVAVTLIVVAVPEGLPMSVTLSLALSMRKMLKNNNLVRKMHACETMGATTVICTDKTGTLTQNRMTVNDTLFLCLENDTLLNSDIVQNSIALNSTAYLDFSDENNIKILGNPTEAALLLWLNENDIDYLNIRNNSKTIEQLTFSTERKYMATLTETNNEKMLYVKGAPEIVLEKCNYILTKNGIESIDQYKSEIESTLLGYQNKAMRTIGFAYEVISDDLDRFENNNIVNSKLIFLGVAAISDPIREDVPMAVNECLNAGIDVKIVTGDTMNTAKEIAKQIGIWTNDDNDSNIITGSDFEKLSDDDASKIVNNIKIVCRARPTDKLRFVQLLQKNDYVVAVTGDGTNDAPALNFAHVGLSMGSGTSVAKEASDITLLDDSFSSITTAVMWGRSLYQNIQKFILFQLTINVAALVIVLIGSLFGHELPLTVTQMLWVNLIMDTFAAAALASLPPSNKVMKDKPRNNNAFIITKAMRYNILFVGFSFVAILLTILYSFEKGVNGENSIYNLSKFFTIFVMLQFWNMFNAKAFQSGKSAFNNIHKSLGFLVVSLVILIGQILIVQFGGDVFRTVPISLKDWVIIISSTSLVLWVGEIYRFFKNK